MPGYIRIAPEQLRTGQKALLLFIHDGGLCAGVLKHGPDGDLQRLVPENPAPSDLILGICAMMADMPADADLFVVLEPPAYWPESFPLLRSA